MNVQTRKLCHEFRKQETCQNPPCKVSQKSMIMKELALEMGMETSERLPIRQI